MTDAELFGCFDHEYTPEGFPKLAFPREREKSAYEWFVEFCKRNRVVDRAVIRKLWAEEQVRRKEAAAERRKRVKEMQDAIRAAKRKQHERPSNPSGS